MSRSPRPYELDWLYAEFGTPVAMGDLPAVALVPCPRCGAEAGQPCKPIKKREADLSRPDVDPICRHALVPERFGRGQNHPRPYCCFHGPRYGALDK